MHISEKEYYQTFLSAGIKLDLRGAGEHELWINIFGTMLFPDKQQRRLAWIARVFIANRARMHQEMVETDNPASLSVACEEMGRDFKEVAQYMGGPLELSNLLFGAQYNKVEIEGMNRIENGLLAGAVFLDVMRSGKSLSESAECIGQQTGLKGLKEKIIKNLWPLYLPAIHYWAAMVTFKEHGGINLENTGALEGLFICPELRAQGRTDGLKGFIRTAESYLLQGIKHVPRRTGYKTPLLDIKKMVFVLHPFTQFSSLVLNSPIINDPKAL